MMFRSRKHKVKTLKVNKLALSSEDDKRISINGIDSLAMGHYKLQQAFQQISFQLLWLSNCCNI